MKKSILLATVAISLVLGACFKEDTPSEPAYVRVENIQLVVDPSNGAGTSNITDAWISVDGQSLGASTLPVMLPVILDENFTTNSIRISAGIKNNGITNSRAIYPMYEPYVVTTDLEPGEIFIVNPIFTYDPQAVVRIVEDFETPAQPVLTDDLDGNPNTEVVTETVDVRSGNYSGRIMLDSNDLECTVASSVRYANLIGIGSTPVYLEMDYKTNVPIQVGLRAHYSSGNSEAIYKGGVNDSKGVWRKIYFEFTAEVFGTNAAEYSVLFRAISPLGTENPEILIDNIKLVHF